MKIIKLSLAAALMAFLCGAFYNVSFDPSIWSEGCRFFTIAFWLIATVGLASFNYLDEGK